MMIGCYDIYDRFTMEHLLLCQRMISMTSFFAGDSTYILLLDLGPVSGNILFGQLVNSPIITKIM
jgi:hypothetical protein